MIGHAATPRLIELRDLGDRSQTSGSCCGGFMKARFITACNS